jgi:hypothetical protein
MFLIYRDGCALTLHPSSAHNPSNIKETHHDAHH